MNFYQVLVPLPLFEPLIYASPQEVLPGTRVLVEVRRKKCIGLVWRKVSEPTDFEPKAVEEILEESPLLPPDLLAFLFWCWCYYLAPPGEVVKRAFPPGFFKPLTPRYRLTEQGRKALESGDLPPEAKVLKRLTSLSKVPPLLKALLPALLAQGLVEERLALQGLSPPTEKWLEYLPGAPPREPLERFLAEKGRWPKRFCEEQFGRKAVKTLLSLGQAREVLLPRLRRGPILETGEPPLPNPDQKRVIKALSAALNRFEVYLLHGVTGSGKTLVYLYAAEKVLAQGGSVLILVPEIALTPYVETHLVARFGAQVAILHSALSAKAREAEWFRIARGEARVVVGTRLALFAPLKNLGLIVVDEEHDSSYKQQEGLRYQARDMALMRAKLSQIPVLLGSATPSVKSYFWAQKGKYRLLRLPRRARGQTLPALEVVKLKRPGEWLSETLLKAVKENLEQGQQVLLFLNRKGYAPLVFCKDCGQALECPNCSLSLTYHRSFQQLRCHYCGFVQPAFPLCPRCAGADFRLVGLGTERVEEELKKIFPTARIARLDRQTITSEGRLLEVLSQLRKGQVDILVGTQMVAQGHDWPGVGLVGILWAEGGLYFPDFRAAEKTFQLLVQVAGRAGRGRFPGRVILQTLRPEHYVIQAALRQDYEAFFKEEIARRKALGWPPFSRLALLLCTALREEKAREGAERLAGFFSRFSGLEIWGPAPAPYYRLAARYRWHLLLKSPENAVLQEALEALRGQKGLLPAGVRLILDRDPEELL